jgi:hypothetical protein
MFEHGKRDGCSEGAHNEWIRLRDKRNGHWSLEPVSQTPKFGVSRYPGDEAEVPRSRYPVTF